MVVSCKSEAEKKADESAKRAAIIDSTVFNFQKIYLKNQIDSVFAKTGFNGNISVYQANEKIYEKENGFMDFSTKSKLDSNSVFAIGSLSKQFTAVLVLLQEEQGKLSTKDLVSKYLNEFKGESFKNITVQQLLNHTSGLNDFGSSLLSKPGEKFNYSNKGFRYLGELVEKVSGKSYDENAKELFAKAGMRNSSTPNLFQGKDFAGAYTGNSNNFQKIDNMPKRLDDKEISVAAGGILSTVPDLHRWNDALYNGRILKPESLQKFMEKSSGRNHPILGKMGYGFGIMMNQGKPLSYFHTGYVKGSPSLNIYYPETKTSVIILSNIADESKGKDAIFIPHKEVKKLTDAIESSVAELRKEMIKI